MSITKPFEPWRAVIFDLDGTLLNTLGDLAACLNRVLTRQGHPTHEEDAYRWFIGDGLEKLVERSLPPQARRPDTIAATVAAMRAEYAEHWADITRPYPGVPELLARLSGDGLKLAVLSNKPHKYTLEMVDYFFPNAGFAAIDGAKPEVPIKPDPAPALATARSLALEPGQCVYLGDSAVDVLTAKGAGMLAAGAAWGFRGRDELAQAGADVILEEPLDLLQSLA